MQLENTKYRSTFECAKDLALNKGLTSLSRGFMLTVLRETPACAVYFASFEHLTNSKKSDDASFWKLLWAGGVAGCLSWIITYPIDSVKTRYQANSSYNSSIGCAIEFYKNEGFKGLWRGLTVALVRSFPNNAACLATVTMVDRHFKK
jgi:solute carrier family 25 carnitine/acylcarnitine transporter 20/29